jgi:hypothetical protein
MPTKVSQGPAASPAWTFTLMTGELPPCRLTGWVDQAQSTEKTVEGFTYTPAGDRLWAEHQEALEAEASAAGFVPFWKTNRTPTGAGFERWRAAFLAEHRY